MLLLDNFFLRVNDADENGCMFWTGFINKYGHGSFRTRPNALTPVHRFAYEIAYGLIPKDYCVFHKCGKKHCVNHLHLYLDKAINKLVSLERFKKKMRSVESGCIEWTGSLNHDGYGVLRINKIPMMAHRQSYIYFVDDFPREMKILHKCDNRKCVNPEHLFIGTQADNVYDMVAKDRHTKKRDKL